MITDLVQIRRLGYKKRNENSRFRSYLKSHRHSDRSLQNLAEEIQSQIDCTQCANCCRVTETGIDQRDVEKLAKFLGMSKDEFLRDCTQRAEDNELILRRNEGGCIFLKDNLCTVYEARPQNCAKFPHLVRGNGSIASRMWSMLDRVEYCPIVYNWMELVKEDLGFR